MVLASEVWDGMFFSEYWELTWFSLGSLEGLDFKIQWKDHTALRKFPTSLGGSFLQAEPFTTALTWAFVARNLVIQMAPWNSTLDNRGAGYRADHPREWKGRGVLANKISVYLILAGTDRTSCPRCGCDPELNRHLLMEWRKSFPGGGLVFRVWGL